LLVVSKKATHLLSYLLILEKCSYEQLKEAELEDFPEGILIHHISQWLTQVIEDE
jgi:hypothetical protein